MARSLLAGQWLGSEGAGVGKEKEGRSGRGGGNARARRRLPRGGGGKGSGISNRWEKRRSQALSDWVLPSVFTFRISHYAALGR